MAVTSPQTFGSDYILEKLVVHFNSLSPAARTIKSTDLPLYNVKVIADGDGQPTIVVGDQSATFPAAQYVGEATYTWVGPRNVPATATAASFFEISKYVNASGGSVNIVADEVTHFGTLPQPNIVPSMPQGGDLVYAYRISSTADGGWFGAELTIILGGQSYVFSMRGGGTIEGLFTTYPGTSVEVTYDGSIGDGAFMQLIQYEAGDSITGPTAVAVIDNNGALVELGNNFTESTFVAPFVPLTFNMDLAGRTMLTNDNAGTGFGLSISTNSQHSKFVVRNQNNAGTTRVYNNNVALGGVPSFSTQQDELYGGWGSMVAMSEDGLFYTSASGSFATVIRRFDGTNWVNDGGFLTGGTISQQFIVNDGSGVPTLVLSNRNNNRILIYKRISDVWTLHHTINAPVNASGFAVPLAVNNNATMITCGDTYGNCYAFILVAGTWATGTINTITLTNMLTADTGPAYVQEMCINANNDLAISYRYDASSGSTQQVLEVYGDLKTNGSTASLLGRLEHAGEPFSNLTHCDYASSTMTQPGFVAVTAIGEDSIPVIVWLSPEINSPSNKWPYISFDNTSHMMFKAPTDLNPYGTLTTCLAPALVSRTAIKFVAGLYNSSSVEYLEYD